VLAAGLAAAASYQIVGQKLQIKDKATEKERKVTVQAKEPGTDIPPIPDLTTEFVTLDISTYGTTPSSVQYFLSPYPAPYGWKASNTGAKYKPAPGDSNPVKQVAIKRTTNGTALLKVQLKGDIGSSPLNLEPANPGSGGSLSLATSTDRYCVNFGGAAGGAIKTNTEQQFKVVCGGSAPCVETACPCSTNAAPTCGGGHCPNGEECFSIEGFDPFFGPTTTCGCLATGSTACGPTNYPACGDACPAGSSCIPYTDPFNGNSCRCVAPPEPACQFINLGSFIGCFGTCSPGASCGLTDLLGGECACIEAPGVPCGQAAGPTCGGECVGGETCVPIQEPFFGTSCACTPASPCCGGGYECGPSLACTYDISFTCAGCVADTPPPACDTPFTTCGSCGPGLCFDYVSPNPGSQPNACVDFGTCMGASCSSDADCPASTYCVLGGGACCSACP
jgi:hypothetical protein